jgi:2-amino-4-hydroxy-6-hydroxymethyldihydropteridine diphosphokinase
LYDSNILMAASNTAFLLLGSNIEPRLKSLKLALIKLQEHHCDIISASSVYESEAWGFESEQSFLNRLLVIETDLSPTELLHDILNIEKELGRTRDGRISYVSRNIDIDILYFNNEVIETEELTIPHPRLQKRRFALKPLVEVAPEYVHPLLKKTNKELLEGVDDPSRVYLYNEKEVCSDEV